MANSNVGFSNDYEYSTFLMVSSIYHRIFLQVKQTSTPIQRISVFMSIQTHGLNIHNLELLNIQGALVAILVL